MDGQFTKNGDYLLPPLTIVNINILDELWEGYTEDGNGNNDTNGNGGTNGTPGFESGVILLSSIAVIILLNRKYF